MNTINSEIQKQKLEIQQKMCQYHKSEIVCVDLDTSQKSQFSYLCFNCLFEKMKNHNISTIEQIQERIQIINIQKYENKIKVIQQRLDQFQRISNQILDFKREFESALEKIYVQITAQILKIQEEKSLILENHEKKKDFEEELKLLSEQLQRENYEKQLQFQQDSQFIDQICQQFERQFNNDSYFQTIHTFQDAKQKINETNENIKYELMVPQSNNNKNTLTLKSLCPKHDKEIIMIDIDTKDKKMEDRFVCVNCISDQPNCQYRTIEKINEELNQIRQKEVRILNDLQIKRQEKYMKLNQQISIMRKNYNQQLNNISEKLFIEFSQPINEAVEIFQLKQTFIQELSQDELISSLSYMIQSDKENEDIYQKVEQQKSKDTIFIEEIENKLEHLQQIDQLDIQESINILHDQQSIQNLDDNQIQGLILLSQQIQEITKINQEQLIIKKELDELINSSKSIYCSMGIFNQTILKYQEHLKKITYFSNKMKSIPDLDLPNFPIQVQDYNDKFENDFKFFKQFCDNQKLEIVQQEYEKFQQESLMKIEEKNKIIHALKENKKDMEQKLKNQEDQIQQLQKLKEELNQNIENQKIQYENKIQELNQELDSKDIQVQQAEQENLAQKQRNDDIWQEFYVTVLCTQLL